MMKAIVRYYELAHKAIVQTSKKQGQDRITFANLKQSTSAQLNKLKNMKFENPRVDKKVLVEIFAKLVDEITSVLNNLMNK